MNQREYYRPVKSGVSTRDVMVWRRVFAGRGDQVAPARHLVRTLLGDTNRGDDAEWVAAELISNALLYSRSGRPRGFFVVEVRRDSRIARIAVRDLGGGGVPRLTPSWQVLGGELDEHGYGLRGVGELAAAVGVDGDPNAGHEVWAELGLECSDVQAASPHKD
ncbi:ATP-binding protein [Spongiactinospora sp. TRM90649]|uniref:ATP-binding protein n=1 Tax=Spongiactinospora sp. TRM90649 TaxID=3031114 RepID=UPI0023F95D04|nr:ATP-binding protein [Spongiactinospora sp. TRM90649]MDF5758787.1 ATP-binding protein [Spongiactinospora sp. TRM90649]